MTTLDNDLYYKRVLPLMICDSVKEVYIEQKKKIIQNGVMTNILDVWSIAFHLTHSALQIHF